MLNVKGINESLEEIKNAITLDLINGEKQEIDFLVLSKLLEGIKLIEKNLVIYQGLKEGKK